MPILSITPNWLQRFVFFDCLAPARLCDSSRPVPATDPLDPLARPALCALGVILRPQRNSELESKRFRKGMLVHQLDFTSRVDAKSCVAAPSTSLGKATAAVSSPGSGNSAPILRGALCHAAFQPASPAKVRQKNVCTMSTTSPLTFSTGSTRHLSNVRQG